jgi:hypothetical protein
MPHNVCESFSYCLLYGPCVICVYFMSNFFCYHYSILEKCLYVVSSYCVCVVFILFLLHLSVYLVALWFIPHPIIDTTNLRIHGMLVWMYVCMYVLCITEWFYFRKPMNGSTFRFNLGSSLSVFTYEGHAINKHKMVTRRDMKMKLHDAEPNKHP